MTSAQGAGTSDFLSHCQTTATGNPVLEQIRDRGADVVLALFRLVKNAMVHAVDNQAVIQTAAQSRQVIADFSAMVGNQASITFLEETIFVCGQLLRASRMVYESAVELGQVFARCEISEVSFDAAVTAEDLITFAARLVQGYRVAERREELLTEHIPHVEVRRVESRLEQRVDESSLSVDERIVRLYATSLVVMRNFFDSVAAGTTVLPYRVKRLAQQIVSLSESGDPVLLGLTAVANAERDDAGRSVVGAILAVVVGRQITSERVPLARLAMAGLMADVGRVRVAGPGGRDMLLELSDEESRGVPAATATVCVATGGVNVPNALRTVVTTEVTWLERDLLLGPLYEREMTPLVEAQILRLARALIDELAPRDATVAARSPLDALAAVASTRGVDPVILRLLVNAVGLMPTGSVVEFETGEWGVVMGPSKTEGALERPIVRLVTDRNGRPLTPPREVDLGSAGPGSRAFPRITNVVPPKQARFNVTRVFLR